jgi:hypothetical protein
MYSRRLVAFIDLLGFKNSVQSKDFSEVEKILSEFTKMINNADQQNTSRLAHAHIAAKKFDKDVIRFDTNKQNMTFFSDCVVWSYPMDEIKVDFIHSLMSLISSFVVLQFVLFSKGILVRGGVTFGDIYQNNNKVFGDALIRAYQLEQSAKYPRIAFDIKILNLFDNRLLKLIQHEITFSTKGFFFIDLFKYVKAINKSLLSSDKEEDNHVMRDLVLKGHIESICNAIVAGRQYTDPRIREKYDWMETKLRAIENLQVPLTGL